MRRAAAIAALLISSACAQQDPTIVDGSSTEAFDRTTEQARRDLPAADRLAYDRALRTVGGRSFSARDPAALARVTFDGMTAAEIVADQRARDQGG
jgi:hypothetical protein